MKYRAHIAPSPDSETILIFDVVDGLKSDPKFYENRIYYSLWYFTPMYAKPGAKTPHFAFCPKASHHPNESVGGESIEHATTKHIILRNKQLNLRRAGKEGIVRFSEISMEKPFGNIDYIGDIYAKLESDENNVLELKKGDWISIEIYKSHKTSKYKEAYYRKENIAAIEITYYNEIKFDGNRERLDKRIEGWLKIPLHFKRLHNPYYMSFYKTPSPTVANNNKEKEIIEIHPTSIDCSTVESVVLPPAIIEPSTKENANTNLNSPETEKSSEEKTSMLKWFFNLLGF